MNSNLFIDELIICVKNKARASWGQFRCEMIFLAR